MHGLGRHRGALDHDRRDPQVTNTQPRAFSHIGFNKEANKDVAGTLREAVARINTLPNNPSFMLHTGDLTHLAEAEEFDTLDQLLKESKTRQVFYVPGEHAILNDN